MEELVEIRHMSVGAGCSLVAKFGILENVCPNESQAKNNIETIPPVKAPWNVNKIT